MKEKIFKIFLLLLLSDSFYFNKSNLKKLFRKYKSSYSKKSLDIGCGNNPRNPFEAEKIFGIDFAENLDSNVYGADLAVDNLPFNDEDFDYVTAFDTLEHIPRVSISSEGTITPFIKLMNEINRVLKSNGIFFALYPAYPFSDAFIDPTHVNIMTEKTIKQYFCEPYWARTYGFQGEFKFLYSGWIKSKHFIFIQKK